MPVHRDRVHADGTPIVAESIEKGMARRQPGMALDQRPFALRRRLVAIKEKCAALDAKRKFVALPRRELRVVDGVECDSRSLERPKHLLRNGRGLVVQDGGLAGFVQQVDLGLRIAHEQEAMRGVSQTVEYGIGAYVLGMGPIFDRPGRRNEEPGTMTALKTRQVARQAERRAGHAGIRYERVAADHARLHHRLQPWRQ
ncbi:hypothetical protein ABUE31_14490 [Mesorhizobium sp. ZMM04-5]|uniref:Transposase n=1 Tax=Mesorhizobium marinum TaxID=3228790 RepID=A0ABV3R345_9HYPH